MSRIQPIGVSNAVKMADVQAMGGDANQDKFIRDAAQDLEQKLRQFVGDARPVSEVGFTVTGPHSDPLQGLIYVHTMWANFDLDALPTDSDAYRVHVTEESGAKPLGGQA